LLSEDTEKVLTAYGIPFAASKRVKTAGDAVTAANELGFPVVVKAEAKGLIHKSEHRAVATDLDDSDDVYAAAKDLLTRLRRHFKGLTLQVQAMARGHREVLLGMTRDERFGPLFALGLGGTLVEVLRDVSVRVGPLDNKDPAEMIAKLKGAAVLGEFRGEPAVQVEIAENCLLRLQQLVEDFPRIQEVEINPFILGSKRVKSVAVDARIRIAK
jgi:acetyltransferase